MVRRVLLVALCLACAAPARPAPDTLWAPLGPVRVKTVPNFRYLGYWDAATRTITLRAGMDPTTRAYVTAHEVCHASLFDLGVTSLDEATEDEVCDAWGAARVLEQKR